jgi:RNA-directed DNA polymerase
METKLSRIAAMAIADPKLRFTSIGHFIDAEALEESHYAMEAGKATGVDGVTKETYGAKGVSQNDPCETCRALPILRDHR